MSSSAKAAGRNVAPGFGARWSRVVADQLARSPSNVAAVTRRPSTLGEARWPSQDHPRGQWARPSHDVTGRASPAPADLCQQRMTTRTACDRRSPARDRRTAARGNGRDACCIWRSRPRYCSEKNMVSWHPLAPMPSQPRIRLAISQDRRAQHHAATPWVKAALNSRPGSPAHERPRQPGRRGISADLHHSTSAC